MRFAHTIDGGQTIRRYAKTDRRNRLWIQHGEIVSVEMPVYAPAPPDADIDFVPEQIGTETTQYFREYNPARGEYVTTAEEAAVHGWFPVDDVTNPRPEDDVDTRYVSEYVFNGAVFERVWNPVAKTQEEKDAEAAAAAEEAAAEAEQDAVRSEQDAAKAAVDALTGIVDGTSSMTNQQIIRLFARILRRLVLDTYR